MSLMLSQNTFIKKNIKIIVFLSLKETTQREKKKIMCNLQFQSRLS